MKDRNAVRQQLQRARGGASKGALAVALTLSLCPTAAFAQTEGAADSDATNTETVAPLSSEAETASIEHYTLIGSQAATFATAGSYDLSKIADGTYESTVSIPENGGDAANEDEWVGYDVTVSVTVVNHAITKVEVTGTHPSQSKKYFNWAASGNTNTGETSVPDQIVAKQSTDVDVVTNATFTSNAIMQAAAEALAKAPTEGDGGNSGEESTPVTEETKAKLQETYENAAKLVEKDYTPESWSKFVTARDETKDLLDKGNFGEAEAAEQTKHLQSAIDDLVSITSEYTFGYAALSWTEYWSGEGVQNGSSAASSEELDSRGESDLGAFDAVTRATINHGVARGSFQCTSVFHTTDGTDIQVSHWTDGTTFVTPDGKIGTYNKGALTLDGASYTMKNYSLTGLRYVPVMVKNSDLNAFEATHEFVANGETLYVGQPGSTAEKAVEPYTATAAVDADTNGLKKVEKSGDGFSFSAAATGTGSGIEGVQAKVANFTPVVKKNTDKQAGAFGEFLRVDFTDAGYGDLGANMQAVTWTYYGDDATRTTPQATFGTKFAADNWMHSSMGIQLGLTDSERCQLPAGTDGTGYWSLTIRALGYEDFTVNFEATKDNIVEPVPADGTTVEELQAAADAANALIEGNYTAESWSAFVAERNETNELLKSKNLTKAAALTQIEHLNAAIEGLVRTAPAEGDYVLMNIPYDKFYAAETPNNPTDVDVFTSATKNKTRTGSLAGGSYHVNADGSDITGITFPVKVTKEAADSIDWSKFAQVTDDSSVSITVTNRGNTATTDYKGKDALFESASYSFYELASADAPANYKELTVDADGNPAFGAVEGAAAKTVSDDAADFTTNSQYGDYELDLSSSLVAEGGALEGVTVYGVVVNTTDNTGYGMRHIENIWRTTELAWSTGFTKAVHNCPTSSAHYESMMGKTIKSVTYYTSKGTVEVALGSNGIYVPIKTADAKVTATDASLDDVSPSIVASVALPDGFQPEYSIDGKAVSPTATDDANKTVTFDAAGLKVGSHTLTVSDKSGKYADISCAVSVTTAKSAAAFDSDKLQLVAASGATADELANYLGNIKTVEVNGVAYSATGRGSVVLINKDGTLNVNAVDAQKNPIFGAYGNYAITVKADGYTTDLGFTYTKQADKTTLNKAIASAKALDKDKYTTSSWAEFEKAIAAAEEVANKVTATDDEVASAIDSLSMASLAERADADTLSALQQQVDSGKNLSETGYTAKTWSAYQTALNDANKVLANAADKTDADVEAATTALKKAQDALVAAPTDEQKTALANQIAAGKDLKESDYTADSWKTYQDALTKANGVAADKDASANEVEEAAKVLKDAQGALEKAPAVEPGNDPAADPDKGSDGAGSAEASAKQTATDGAAATADANGGAFAATGDVAPVAAVGIAGIGAAILAAVSRALRRREQD